MTTPPEEADAALTDWWADSARWSAEQLERHAPRAADGTPAKLAEAMNYALLGGGKRLRPSLVRLFARAFGGSDESASRAAAAIEMVHTYSLIHDDLPCMDDDDLRRGRPTCHVAFDEATAVLAGDALLTLAFEVIADGTRLFRVLTDALGNGEKYIAVPSAQISYSVFEA